MPKLSDLGNADAVDSVYAGRSIVYVEADSDSDVYARMVGMNGAKRVLFKAPLGDQGGYSGVCAQVKAERASGKLQTFGLVDGEAAASLGGLDALLGAANTIFPLPDHDGIFCLADHELENLLVQHGDICGHLLKDVSLATLSSRNLPDLEAKLKVLTRRFFIAAMLKYAALNLRHANQPYDPVAIDRFKDKSASLKTILAALKKLVADAGLDWPTFAREVFRVTRTLRKRFQDEQLSAAAREPHLLRLADGKGLLYRMRKDHGAPPEIEGHLVDKLVRSAYANAFREEILGAVAA